MSVISVRIGPGVDKRMDRKTDPSTDDVIDRIYEVAVDPSRYERLLDHWEAMIAPRRPGAPPVPA